MHGPSPSLRQIFAAELPRLFTVAYHATGSRAEAHQRMCVLVRLAAAADIPAAPRPAEALLILLIRNLEELLGRKAEKSLQILDDILRDDITHPIDLNTPGIDGDFDRLHPLLWELKRTCLTSVLACLPPGVRISFILTDLLGYSPAASAEMLAINESAYRVRLTRARKRLDNYLAPMCQYVDNANPCNCEGRLGAALNKGFIAYPPHTEDVPVTTHDDCPEYHEMGALYRALPVISLSIAQREQLLDACSSAAEPLEIDINLDSLDNLDNDDNLDNLDDIDSINSITNMLQMLDGHPPTHRHGSYNLAGPRALGPIEPDHPAGPDEPAQPDDPIIPGPEPIPVPNDPA